MQGERGNCTGKVLLIDMKHSAAIQSLLALFIFPIVLFHLLKQEGYLSNGFSLY